MRKRTRVAHLLLLIQVPAQVHLAHQALKIVLVLVHVAHRFHHRVVALLVSVVHRIAVHHVQVVSRQAHSQVHFRRVQVQL